MIKKIGTAMLILVISTNLFAQKQISLSELGNLEQTYSVVKQFESVRMRPMKATVSHKSGEAFKLVAPFTAQKHQYLVNNGQLVAAGDEVLLLSGSEVHHFIEQYEAAKDMFELASRRYQKNMRLFQQKSISNERWMSIAEFYFTAKIEFGHYRHFYDWIGSVKSEDEITIKAPVDGLFIYPDATTQETGELKLGQLVSLNDLRLNVFSSDKKSKSIVFLETEKCRMGVAEISDVSEGYFRQVWSEPLTTDCDLIIGQEIQVTPHQKISAFQVPKSSVFSLNKTLYVLVKHQEQLQLTPIKILNSEKDFYFIESTADINGKQVLSSSVAAVQGILMGLGGE